MILIIILNALFLNNFDIIFSLFTLLSMNNSSHAYVIMHHWQCPSINRSIMKLESYFAVKLDVLAKMITVIWLLRLEGIANSVCNKI